MQHANQQGGNAVRASTAYGQLVPSAREGRTPRTAEAPRLNFNTAPAEKPRCAATAKHGGPCKGYPAKSTLFCAGHLRQQGII